VCRGIQSSGGAQADRVTQGTEAKAFRRNGGIGGRGAGVQEVRIEGRPLPNSLNPRTCEEDSDERELRRRREPRVGPRSFSFLESESRLNQVASGTLAMGTIDMRSQTILFML